MRRSSQLFASQLDTARQRSFRLDHHSGIGEKFQWVVLLLALPEGKSGGGQFARYRDPRQFRARAVFDQALIISLAFFITERGQRRAFENMLQPWVVVPVQSASRNLLLRFDDLPLGDLVVGARSRNYRQAAVRPELLFGSEAMRRPDSRN